MFVFLTVCLFVCLCDIHSSFHDCCYFHYFRFFSRFNMVLFFLCVCVCARACVSVCFYGNFPPLMSLGSLDAIDFIGFFFFFFHFIIIFILYFMVRGLQECVFVDVLFASLFSNTASLRSMAAAKNVHKTH